MWNLFKVNSKDTITTSLVFLLLALNTFHILLQCLYCWYWTCKWRVGFDAVMCVKIYFPENHSMQMGLRLPLKFSPPLNHKLFRYPILSIPPRAQPLKFLYFVMPPTVYFYIVCIFVKNWLNQSEDEIYCQN